eukprot:7201999-Alexandrium_andersonii.AAC.1
MQCRAVRCNAVRSIAVWHGAQRRGAWVVGWVGRLLSKQYGAVRRLALSIYYASFGASSGNNGGRGVPVGSGQLRSCVEVLLGHAERA